MIQQVKKREKKKRSNSKGLDYAIFFVDAKNFARYNIKILRFL